ncbi:MAG: ribonuclease H-like domain-containing protein [Nannocystaceae bacterium]
MHAQKSERATLQTMGGEAAMLQDVMGSLGALRSYVLLTYNGKSFDLPVLRGRTQRVGMDAFALHGPHVDLLHPARRLWNTGRGSCRLQRLERDRWGIVRRDDIAGAEIPEVFWAQLASRGAPDTSERMSRVLRHNALDLWSVAAVCEEVVHRLGRPTSLREALAATHRSAQQSPARIIALLQPWLQRAALPTVGLCAERALLASGFQVLVKAQRAVADHLGAVRTLEQWLAVAPGDPRASTQLAMVLERDCRDLEGALRAAAQSREPSVRRIGRLQRRLQAQRTARDASPKGGTGRPSTAGRGRLRSSS